MEALKQQFLKWWFVISSIGLTLLYMFYDRRGREIAKLHADVQSALLAQQLADIKQKSVQSKENYEKAAKEYGDLRARHGDLLIKLGLGDVTVAGSESDSH